MQDKTDAAGYTVSGLAGLLGLATADFLTICISALGVAGTLYISWHFKRLRLREEQRRTDAAIRADEAKRKRFEERD